VQRREEKEGWMKGSGGGSSRKRGGEGLVSWAERERSGTDISVGSRRRTSSSSKYYYY